MKLDLVERNGLLVPRRVAVEMGFGCPKCDDHVLVPTHFGTTNTRVQVFLALHQNCGPLDTLEKLANGEVGITGQMSPKI
jgi:hypothetical protein